MAANRHHPGFVALVLAGAIAATCAASGALGDTGRLRIVADLSRATGTNSAGLPIFAAGDDVRFEVYFEVIDNEGNGYEHQGLAGTAFDFITNTGIRQPPMKPSLTHTGDVARTNHEVWLETRRGAYFVGGFGFDFYDGGSPQQSGSIYGPGLFLWLTWRADMSDDPGLQPYALHGVGYGAPPGTDIGGALVGNRNKWYLMETHLKIPGEPGIYFARVENNVTNMIRRGRDLTEDVTNGYVEGFSNITGDTYRFQAGGGAPPPGYPPEAVLNASVVYGDPPLTIEFDARSSADFNGGELGFEWNFGDGSPIDRNALTTHTFAADGYFNVRLRVTDNEGLDSVAEQTISVGVNAPPTAVMSADVRYGTAPLIVNFDATASTDPENESLIFEWDFDDGGVTFGPTPSHTFEDYGTYDVKLLVTDSEGLTDETTTRITLANQAPQSGFAMSESVARAPAMIDFDGTESFDPDGDSMTYLWNFGDGETAVGPSARHLYLTPGIYNVTLTVTDAHLNERSVGRSLRVLLPDGRVNIPQPNNKIPSVGVSAGPTKGPAPLTVTFGLAGSDPDGDEVSVILDPGNGELISGLAPGEFTTYTYTAEGTYVAEASSFDGRGGNAKTHVAVTVLPPAAAAPQSTNSSRGFCGAGVAQAGIFVAAAFSLLWAVRRRR